MEAATYILLAYSLLVVVSLVVSAVRHPVRGTGGGPPEDQRTAGR
jgi:hypothetical protein